MSIFHFRALAVCSWLLALAMGIACAAYLETYSLYANGPEVRATVTEVRPQSEGVWVRVQLVDEGRPVESGLRLPSGEGIAPGSQLDLRLHQNNRQPILASAVGDEAPTFLMWLGLVAALAGGAALWVLPARAAARRRAARKTALDAIVDAARRTRNHQIGVGFLMIGLGALIGGVPLVDDSAGLGGSIFLGLLGATSAGAGVLGLVRGIRLWDPARNEVIELLERRPADLAWFYVHRVTTNQIQASEALAILLWQANGKSTQLTMVREDLDEVLAEIARRAPHAQQGYDREIERLYRERPDRWRPGARAA